MDLGNVTSMHDLAYVGILQDPVGIFQDSVRSGGPDLTCVGISQNTLWSGGPAQQHLLQLLHGSLRGEARPGLRASERATAAATTNTAEGAAPPVLQGDGQRIGSGGSRVEDRAPPIMEGDMMPPLMILSLDGSLICSNHFQSFLPTHSPLPPP